MVKRKKMPDIVQVLLNYGLIIALCIIIVIVSVSTENFLTFRNIINILRQAAPTGIMALGVVAVIVAGHMDLSISSTVTMSGVVCVSYVKYMQADVTGICLALLTGAGIGLLNGIIIANITSRKGRKGESFIITYGMQAAIAAAALLYTNGIYMNLQEKSLHSFFGRGYVPIVIFFLTALLLEYVMKCTPFGQSVYFMGANEAAARMSGIPVKRITMIIFAISGFFAAVAGVVLTSRIGAASSTSGNGLELDAIAAVVVGGTALSGGKGGVMRTVLGVLVMGVLSNALRLLNIDTYPQMMIRGIIIILAVLLDVFATQFRAKGGIGA